MNTGITTSLKCGVWIQRVNTGIATSQKCGVWIQQVNTGIVTSQKCGVWIQRVNTGIATSQKKIQRIWQCAFPYKLGCTLIHQTLNKCIKINPIDYYKHWNLDILYIFVKKYFT